MSGLLDSPVKSNISGLVFGLMALLLFFNSVVLLAMYVRHRRYVRLGAAIVLLVLSYCLTQCIMTFWVRADSAENRWSDTALEILRWFGSVPPLLAAAFLLCLLIVEILMLRNAVQYEKNHITAMSVKKAADDLPSGLCFFLPSGKVLMANRSAKDFCRTVTGEALLDGDRLCRSLTAGPLQPGCERLPVGGMQVITLPDGSAWSVSVREVPYEKTGARMLLISDITEVFRKTSELRQMHEKLAALNDRLAAYNGEIVALTTDREILNTKVRIHDTLGGSLLSIKRYISAGGTAEELEGITAALRQSISFLQFRQPPAAVRDEYELMLETAEKLGVHVHIEGTLPRNEPYRHILATAVHECLTNTLRHARGDRLSVTVHETEDTIQAVFTNNGDQPVGEIREQGGLRSLRTLTENLGRGTMTVRSVPLFSITLELPKEEAHVV